MVWTIAEDNHLGRGFLGTVLALFVIDLFCMLIRLYTRFLQQTRPELSDYMLLVGFLMAPGSIVWFGSTTAIRVSMTIFYRQLFHPVKTFILISGGVIALNGLAFFVVIMTSLLICRPMRYAAFPEGDGHCGDIRSFQSYTSVSAIVLDAITVALPMPLLWNLSMTRRRKWGLSAIFGLGILICALTILRLIISYQYETHNSTIQSAVAQFLSALEPTLGIIIACMPFFPAFIARLRKRHRQHRQFFRLGSNGQSRSSSGGSNPAQYGNSSSAAAAAGTNAMAAPPPRYPASASSHSPHGHGKHPHTHHRFQEDEDEDVISLAYPLGFAAGQGGEHYYSTVELGLLEEQRRGQGTAMPAAARVANQGRIYITRDFDIQSHSPKPSYVQV
ncbi:uncharacterized protein BDW70DRAFT_164198 [Aspergillus foveolatus]|uniref:uncharacterized protein n=1 Tax=Aspergillus foveolatus TaxID=210207 RepID=UPI003CCD8A30